MFSALIEGRYFKTRTFVIFGKKKKKMEWNTNDFH